MRLTDIIKNKNISKQTLSHISEVPYSTVCDICNEKTDLKKCSVETVYKISKALNMSMEELVFPYLGERIDFELFKSNVCHRLKRLGDLNFIVETLKEDSISFYYQVEWYAESFYLLAMLDYISRLNQVPLCNKYDELRACKLKSTIYPKSILTLAIMTENDDIKRKAYDEGIEEFKRFNIIENEVRNVV